MPISSARSNKYLHQLHHQDRPENIFYQIRHKFLVIQVHLLKLYLKLSTEIILGFFIIFNFVWLSSDIIMFIKVFIENPKSHSFILFLDLSSVTPFKDLSLIGTSGLFSRFSTMSINLSTVTPS